MNSQSLIERLEGYRQRYPQQTETVDDFIDFLQRNQHDSFKRELQEGHVTASCWLLDTTQSHVLLTHHKKLNRWLQLGGHADGEADVQKVALTEAREESSIARLQLLLDGEIFDIDKHRIPARKNEPAHVHYDFRFVLRAVASDSFVVSDESHDLQWVAIDRLDEYTNDESVLRMGQKWLQQVATVE